MHRAKIDELEIIVIKKERTYAITVVLLMLNGLVFLLYKNHKIKRAKELAQTYSEAKSKVINVISHEMRTPLFSILGATVSQQANQQRPKKSDARICLGTWLKRGSVPQRVMGAKKQSKKMKITTTLPVKKE